MKTFKVKEVCNACGGTGLYKGFAEHDGAVVVCRKCKGTGCYEFVHTYEEFKRRKQPKMKVKRVYETNPGIGIGNDEQLGIKLEEFGGMPYEDWKKGKPFPPGSEMRKYVCPKWWCQSAGNCSFNYEKCYDSLGSMFSHCKHFKDKEKCWKEFDEQRRTKK